MDRFIDLSAITKITKESEIQLSVQTPGRKYNLMLMQKSGKKMIKRKIIKMIVNKIWIFRYGILVEWIE